MVWLGRQQYADNQAAIAEYGPYEIARSVLEASELSPLTILAHERIAPASPGGQSADAVKAAWAQATECIETWWRAFEDDPTRAFQEVTRRMAGADTSVALPTVPIIEAYLQVCDPEDEAVQFYRWDGDLVTVEVAPVVPADADEDVTNRVLDAEDPWLSVTFPHPEVLPSAGEEDSELYGQCSLYYGSLPAFDVDEKPSVEGLDGEIPPQFLDSAGRLAG